MIFKGKSFIIIMTKIRRSIYFEFHYFDYLFFFYQNFNCPVYYNLTYLYEVVFTFLEIIVFITFSL